MSCIDLTSTINKQINNEVRRPCSMYILKLNTCARNINNTNVGKKHSSYARVLQRRRACAF